MLATAVAVARKIGKVPVVVGVCHGFVGNRMLRAGHRSREAAARRRAAAGRRRRAHRVRLSPWGRSRWAISPASTWAGACARRKAARAEIADQLCERGWFGQKTGRGFYVYEQGSRAGRPDPEVEQIIVAASAQLGIKRRTIDKQEIVERLIYPMINEGARILEEGIAPRPGDIDVIWVYGYGFPVWRGGPMFYADTVGLPHIRDRLAELARTSGDKRHEPAALLNRLADDGKGFGSLATKAAA